MLFVPPSMPFMDPVPEAEAQSNSTDNNNTNSTSTDTTPPVNLSFESLNITTTSGGTTLSPGEFYYITPTLAWEGTLPDWVFASNSFAPGEPKVHIEIHLPDGNLLEHSYYSPVFDNPSNTVDHNAKTVTLSTFNRQLYTNTNWPVGQYTVTLTADTGNVLSETNESDNVITGTFTVAAPAPPADTTPPVLFPAYYGISVDVEGTIS